MTIEEAREFLINISYKLGSIAVEYLTEKDGEKMREAIKALEQETCEDRRNCPHRHENGNCLSVGGFCMAVDDKHCQLKKEQQEPCEDCISRQATVERLCKIAEFMNEKRNGLGSPYVMAALFIQDNKDEFPPVTPQPKIGHWIGHREHCENLGVMPSGLGAYEWCSNCDCGIDVREWHRNNYNYCPNCGCRMVEPQESEED